MEKRFYGCLEDDIDERDWPYKSIIRGRLPCRVDLRKCCSPVEDQGPIGSCVAHGIVGNLEERLIHCQVKYEDLSRLYMYYVARYLQNETQIDSGCSIRTALKALKKYGCCAERLWEYKPDLFRIKPPQECYEDAKRYCNVAYYRVDSLKAVKKALAQGDPIIMGATLFDSFESDVVEHSGIVPMPKDGENEVGRHCMLIVGFMDATEQFIVRNSWGNKWGLKGYCMMPYKYIGNRELVSDLWVLKIVAF